VRQEGVLLRLVEAVDLIDEEHRGAPGAAQRLRLLDRLADLLDPRQHCRQHDEVRAGGAGQQPRQRGLAHAGRAPQDHRRQPAGVEGHAQGPARRQQVALADDFVDVLRTQPLGQRHGGAPRRGTRITFGQAEQRVLCRHAPIVSAAGWPRPTVR
jgi:hypothetical protein